MTGGWPSHPFWCREGGRGTGGGGGGGDGGAAAAAAGTATVIYQISS